MGRIAVGDKPTVVQALEKVSARNHKLAAVYLGMPEPVKIGVTEADPRGISASLPGAKLDAGKVPLHRGFFAQFPRAAEAVARVSAKGAAKYSWGAWRHVPDGQARYADAQARHEKAVALARGDAGMYDNGPGGTGEPHLAQIAWNALARLELWLIEQEQCNGERRDGIALTNTPHPLRQVQTRFASGLGNRDTVAQQRKPRRGVDTVQRAGAGKKPAKAAGARRRRK